MRKVFLCITVLCCLTFCSQIHGQKSKVYVSENKIVRVEQNVILTVSELATSDEFPFVFGPMFLFSSDSQYIAYIGYENEDFEIFVYGIPQSELFTVGGEGVIDGRTMFDWSPNDSLLVFTRGERIWLFDVVSDSTRQLTDPPKDFYEDYDPSFSEDGKSIVFYRGSRFEYVFSGNMFKINVSGIGLKRLHEEVPRYPTENLQGNE
jgi:hypothetical protein